MRAIVSWGPVIHDQDITMEAAETALLPNGANGARLELTQGEAQRLDLNSAQHVGDLGLPSGRDGYSRDSKRTRVEE